MKIGKEIEDDLFNNLVFFQSLHKLEMIHTIYMYKACCIASENTIGMLHMDHSEMLQ